MKMETNNILSQSSSNSKLKLLYDKIDAKLVKFIPDTKLRKVVIFALIGLLMFFILIIFLGIIVSTGRPRQNLGYFLNKPDILSTSPLPEKPKTPMQENLSKLKTQINSLDFPPGDLTMPIIETEISLKND